MRTAPNPLRTAWVSTLLAACATTGANHASRPAGDPTKAEVALPAGAGWRASLVIDNDGTGIWTVRPMQVFEQYACPEIVGLDDLGRCHVLVSYSGKWTPVTIVADGEWLGGLAQGDVDARIPGKETYTGGKRGNLYQIVAYREGVLDTRRVAHLPGREIHTLIATDLDPERPGDELLIFTRPGGLFLARPKPVEQDGFDVELVQELDGRVRDALLLPRRAGHGPELATAARSGSVEILEWTANGPSWSTVHELPMGRGRLALRAADPARPGDPLVLYSSADDGAIWRHERRADAWRNEAIHAGRQGPRGIASGRFVADASVECVAIFGYSGAVELLTRTPSGWQVETVFEDRDKGHWLAAGEFDSRNATDELVCSGYGARIVLLSRPPGYGRDAAP